MKKFERLEEAAAPDGTVLTLYRHDHDYTIRIDGVELMSTRRHHSEEQLAELVCAPLLHRRNARVLIGAFDAIMLDVDNGADPPTTAGNARLYHAVGIHMAAAALRAGGSLAYWSAHVDPSFERSLRDAGLSVAVTRVRAHVTSGYRHTLYLARRSD